MTNKTTGSMTYQATTKGTSKMPFLSDLSNYMKKARRKSTVDKYCNNFRLNPAESAICKATFKAQHTTEDVRDAVGDAVDTAGDVIGGGVDALSSAFGNKQGIIDSAIEGGKELVGEAGEVVSEGVESAKQQAAEIMTMLQDQTKYQLVKGINSEDVFIVTPNGKMMKVPPAVVPYLVNQRN